MKFIKRKKVLSIILAFALFLSSSVPVFATAAFISENDAQAIVLTHAGVDAENAVFTKTKLDKKTKHYEIKFTCGDDKYEYEINATDGSILDYEWDIEDDENHASPEEPDQRPDYSSNVQAAEESALATLGIAREDAKYINSYVKYGEYSIAYAIHVEIGIYNKAVSPQTVVHSFDFNMDGEIIEQPVPEEPREPTPVEPANPVDPEPVNPTNPIEPEPIEPVNPVEPEPVKPAPVEPNPADPEEPDEDAYDKPDETDEIDSEESEQPETTTQNKKTTTKNIKVNSTKVKLKKGQRFAIKVTRTPSSATDKITYSTSKKKIATVSKKGVITAKSKGSCKITVKCNGKKKVIKVTVK